MKMSVGHHAIGVPSGTSWGLTETGDPVCAFVDRGVMVRIEMTPEEAKEWGTGAIYIGIDAQLRAQAEAPPSPDAAGPQRASLLFNAQGLPLVPR